MMKMKASLNSRHHHKPTPPPPSLTRPRSSVRCSALPPPGFGPEPEAVFNFENIAVFPFWLGMILFPNSKVTETVLKSYAVPCVLGVIYSYLTWWSLSDPAIFEAGP